MCQPGRPGPSGESHDGSPGRAASHSRQSRASFLPRTLRVAPALAEHSEHGGPVEAGYRAESGVAAHGEVPVLVHLVGSPEVAEPFDEGRRLPGIASTAPT